MSSIQHQNRLRNFVERIFALALLVAFSPVLLVAAFAVAIESGFPILFRQNRAGLGGKPFELLKFRSMRTANGGPLITANGDSRVTRSGRILRRYKLDELPQLWNIVRGDMQFIGPRPEVFRYVDIQDSVWSEVLKARPGITDLATLVYRDEEGILAAAGDPEFHYRNSVLPHKLALSIHYATNRTLFSDLRLLSMTALYSFFPLRFDAAQVIRTFAFPEAR